MPASDTPDAFPALLIGRDGCKPTLGSKDHSDSKKAVCDPLGSLGIKPAETKVSR